MDDLLDSVVGSISAWITLQSRSSSSRGPGDSEIYSSGEYQPLGCLVRLSDRDNKDLVCLILILPIVYNKDLPIPLKQP